MTNELNNVYEKLAHHWTVDFLHSPNNSLSILIVALSVIFIIIIAVVLGALFAWLMNRDCPSDEIFTAMAIGLIVILLGGYYYAFNYRANAVIKTALNGHRNEIRKSVYQNTVLNYKNRFETKKWIYNAKIVYNQNIGKNQIDDTKLTSEIFKQTNKLKTIKHNLHKLNYINHAASLNLTYTTAKQLYPDITKEHSSKIKPSQLSDKQLQNDIKKSLNEK